MCDLVLEHFSNNQAHGRYMKNAWCPAKKSCFPVNLHLTLFLHYFSWSHPLKCGISGWKQDNRKTLRYTRNQHKRTYIFRRQPVKGSYFSPLQSIHYGWGNCEFDKDMDKLYIYDGCILSYHLFYFLRYFSQNIMLNFSIVILII